MQWNNVRFLLRTVTHVIHIHHTPSSWKVSLHFVELQFIVKGHQPNTLLGCILDVGDLLAGVSIDDPLGGHPQTKDSPDLVLEETQNRTVE